jgi:hypothetical protein
MRYFDTLNISPQNTLAKSNPDVGIVYDIILDETHPKIKQGKASISDIGTIQFRLSDDYSTNDTDLPLAAPYDKEYTTLPLINEKVEIKKTGLGIFYKRIEPSESINGVRTINVISSKHESNKSNSNQQNTTSYKEVSSTGIAKVNKDTSKKYDKLGNYFEPAIIHRLKLYEGDSLLQSRFGQSIRFSAYNNSKNIFSPTIIFRNGENSDDLKKDENVTIEENISGDGSIIAMTSNEYQLPAISPNIQTKPSSFINYPKVLKGDQLLLNSGRIILSAKSGEMIFYSKKDYGFISDGQLSIDNKLGMNVTVGDNIYFITNDRDVKFNTGNGSIFLGNKETEPMVKGQQLVDILTELMQAIISMQFLTPSGPTKIGPENKPKFDEISSKLNNILSKLNQTS